MPVDLADAKALLARARRHYHEFERLIAFDHLWHVSERQDPKSSEWVYGIALNKLRLVAAGPVIADCANNIASALDHVAAAIAKAQGHARRDNLYFPWGLKDENFEKRLAAVEPLLGPTMTKVIAATRKEHGHEAVHVHSAKQISRDGKHWELKATMGSAHAVQLVTEEFETHMFQVPGTAFDEADSYEFHRGTQKLPSARAWELLIKLTVHGLDEGLANSPDSIFPCAFRFVQGVIHGVEKAQDEQESAEARSTGP